MTLRTPVTDTLSSVLGMPKAAAGAAQLGEGAQAMRQRNLAAVLDSAEAGLGMRPTEAGLDPNWVLTFVAGAEACADLQGQAIWSALLRQELRRPGAVAVQTLRVLSELSAADLALFGRLAAMTSNDFVCKLDETYFNDHGLDATALATLEELRLVRPGDGRVKSFNSQETDRFVVHILYRDRVLRVEHGMAGRVLSFPVLRLTRAGQQIAAAMPLDHDHDYMMRMIALIRAQGFRVANAAILQRDSRDPSIVLSHAGFIEVLPLRRA